MSDDRPRRRSRWRRGLFAGVLAAALLTLAVVVVSRLPAQRSTPIHDPPVLAGQQLWGSCAGGFYARLDEVIVLTSSAHCAAEGTTAWSPDGRTERGVFGPPARLDPCPHPDHTCRPSDMNYLVVAPDQIPWGRLNLVDMGAGGYRVIEADTTPLACEDIEDGDAVDINGRDIHRTGTVTEKGTYLHDPVADGDYFPCMVVAAEIEVGVGDSGGAVLVRGLPAGVTSRSFGGVAGVGGVLGFTPLAEGLDALGLELCTLPDCGLR